MVSSLRERRRLLLQDEILDAARALLSEKGYAAMSMDELSANVGISKPTLYSHFPTKDDIVVAAAVREMERLIAMIETDDSEQTPLERIVGVMHKFIQFHAEKAGIEPRSWTPELFQLLCSRETAISCIRRVDQAVVALVQSAMAAGEIDPNLDPSTVTSAFFALASSLRHVPFIRDHAPQPNAADTLITMFVRGVRPA